MIRHLQEAGFREIQVRARFDCFAGTTKADTAAELGVRGVNLFAVRA
jgi:hypothetical protein